MDSTDSPGGTVIDAIFGEITWQLTPDQLTLGGEQIPDVEIARIGADDPVPHIPIGTRRSDLLRMTLDGSPVELHPGRGRLSRRSYRVVAKTVEGPLLLTPSSPTTARLVRGASYRGDNELGTFERAPDGSVTCTWSSTVSALGVTVEAPFPTPSESAVGHALALAFGTGAQLMLPAFGSALGRMIPG